jgi:hypothetical protein
LQVQAVLGKAGQDLVGLGFQLGQDIFDDQGGDAVATVGIGQLLVHLLLAAGLLQLLFQLGLFRLLLNRLL